MTVLRWLLFLSLILALAPRLAIAQVRAGSITKIDGNANIERNGSTTTAVLSQSVLMGDKLETSTKSSLTIVLFDGSEISLSESSSIVIDQDVVGPVRDSFVKLFKGRLHSVVTPRGGRLPDFEVRTPNAVVGVRGTDFETEYIDGKPCPGFPRCLRYTDVGVYSGIVEVSNPTSPGAASVRVRTGYETTVPCELPPATPGPLGIGDLAAPGYH
jgi:hypothetical protein